MSKKNKALFENVEINDVACATSIRDEAASKLKRVKIGVIIAAIASLSSFLAYKNFDSSSANALFAVSFIGSIIAYVVGGGIKTAFSWALKAGALGLVIFPIPGLNLVTGLTLLCFALYFFFFIPVVIVLMNYFQVKKDFNAAENYLSAYQSAADC